MRTFRSSDLEEPDDGEGFGAALDGPEKIGVGEDLTALTTPISSALLNAPVLELVDRRDLHSRDPRIVRVLFPAGAPFFPNRNIGDNRLR
jgi:hypothetical protein